MAMMRLIAVGIPSGGRSFVASVGCVCVFLASGYKGDYC